MKKVLFTLCSFLLLATACTKENEAQEHNNQREEEEGNAARTAVTGITFKKVDLSGAKTLALASPASVSKSFLQTKADDPEVYLLYKVDENDGSLVEVEYTIIVEVEGDVDQETISARMKLAMEYVYTIGDKWLWLYNCRYECENLEEITDESIRNAVIKLIDDYGTGHSFLVRRADGALFPWDDVSNPSSSFFGMNHRRMEQYEVDYCVNNVGASSIVTSVMDWNYGGAKLYCIDDTGDVLEVKKLLNDSVWAMDNINPAVPGQDAFIFRPTHVNEWVVMFTKTATMKLIAKENLKDGYNPDGIFFNYDNKLYTSTSTDKYWGIEKEDYLYWLHLASSGEDVYLFHNRYCSITLDTEETIMYRRATVKNPDKIYYYSLQATSNDSMCFELNSQSTNNNNEEGIILPPGDYEFVYNGRLYVDEANNRTHDIGPVHYIYPLNVDTSAQTASWGSEYMHYFGNIEASYYEGQAKYYGTSGNVFYIISLDMDNRRYSAKYSLLPSDFPKEGYGSDGIAYVITANNSFGIYSLETLQKETVPIVMSQLPVDIVGDIQWYYDGMHMLFYGSARTLEGSYITIYVPVTGENRGVARVTVFEASGAGDNISQLIRLN